ncbi:MAG: hypothetical protein COA33_012490 [Fluviicola sp.]|nr:hypothetical protein [Fluviicola sp.]
MILFFGLLLFQGVCHSQNDSLDNHKSELDSSVNLFISGLSDFTEIDSNKFSNELKLDSLFKLKKLFNFSGELNNGMDYGLLVGYVDTSSSRPFRVLNSNADLQVTSLGLPLNVSYSYSNFRNPLGVNNYFRISVDTDKLKQKSEQKKSELIGNVDSQINDVKNIKSQLTGKLGYGEILMERLDREINSQKKRLESQKSELQELKSSQVIDSTNVSSKIKDSIMSSSKLDSLERKYSQAQKAYQKTIALYDTIYTLYSKAKGVYTRYSNIEQELEEKKEFLNDYSGLVSKKNIETKLESEAVGRKSGIINDIKTLDIGLTYPKTTALSNNSVPIKGLHLELQRKKWYSSVSVGTTVNNLFVSNDIVQNKLVNTQNLFNQFDFQSITEKGFLVNIISGYGTKEGSHIFLGVRHLSNSRVDLALYNNPSTPVKTPSLGLEIDTRIIPRFLPDTKIDFVYGKTSQTSKLIDGTRKSVVNSLFSNDRTNTGLVKIIQPIKRLKTRITASARWIDPSADMRSLGVLQPNNFRYELRSRHTITRRLNVGLNYRRDQNNVARTSDSTINLNIIGGEINGQIGRIISYFGTVNYLTQSTMSNSLEFDRKNNYMLGAGISYQYELNDTKNAITFSYNDYLITDSISTNLFRNIGVQNLTFFRKGKNSFSVSYFKSGSDDFEESEAIIIGEEYVYGMKRVKINVGVKFAYNNRLKNDIGFKAGLIASLTDFIEFSLSAEKLILGNFYNSYDRQRFDNFPYAILSNIKFKLK